jgi:hypothetical protein
MTNLAVDVCTLRRSTCTETPLIRDSPPTDTMIGDLLAVTIDHCDYLATKSDQSFKWRAYYLHEV